MLTFNKKVNSDGALACAWRRSGRVDREQRPQKNVGQHAKRAHLL
jgi:hypothetical protein